MMQEVLDAPTFELQFFKCFRPPEAAGGPLDAAVGGKCFGQVFRDAATRSLATRPSATTNGRHG